MAHLVVPGPVRASCGPAAQKGSGQTRGGGRGVAAVAPTPSQRWLSAHSSRANPFCFLLPQGKKLASGGRVPGCRQPPWGSSRSKGEMGSAPCWQESCSSPRAPITLRGCQSLRTRALKAFCKCSRHRRCPGPPRGGFARGSGPRPLCLCDMHHGPGALPLLAPACPQPAGAGGSVSRASGGALPEGARPLDSAPRAPHHRGQDRDREGRWASRQVRTDPFPDCHLCVRYFTTGATWAGRRGKEMVDQQQLWEGTVSLSSC